MPRPQVTPTEVFKALGDPIRWSIVQQMAEQDEIACSRLEDTLPVSKPTISYHTKILTQAGLIEVHKRGRNYFYSLRSDVLRDVLGELWSLVPGAHLRDANETDATPSAGAALKPAAGEERAHVRRLLTW
jgi:DNA-binding transcriptional ArsR family regulator